MDDISKQVANMTTNDEVHLDDHIGRLCPVTGSSPKVKAKGRQGTLLLVDEKLYNPLVNGRKNMELSSQWMKNHDRLMSVQIDVGQEKRVRGYAV